MGGWRYVCTYCKLYICLDRRESGEHRWLLLDCNHSSVWNLEVDAKALAKLAGSMLLKF